MLKLGDKVVIDKTEYLVILLGVESPDDVENFDWVCIIDIVGRIYKSDGKVKSHRVVDLSDLNC